MYDLSEYDYDVPEELIAQEPLSRRSGSRLMTVNKSTGDIGIGKFKDISAYFSKGDVLVLNETKVIPARLFGVSERNSAAIELFLVREIDKNVWEIMIKPGRKVKTGDTIRLEKNALCAIQGPTEEGHRIAIFNCSGDFYKYIKENGKVPLPHYIGREPVQADKTRYQTVFARVPGAVAAPTAGLHFTNGILKELSGKGVNIVKVILHVGAGTFKPIKTINIRDHKMHSEYYEVPEETASSVNKARKSGEKIFAVGTTVVRALETMSDQNGNLKSGSGNTDIFIYPGYKFKITDRIITNFHLPKSTLILLVSAFSSIELIKRAYSEAVKAKMRFFSYGDAMLII